MPYITHSVEYTMISISNTKTNLLYMNQIKFMRRKASSMDADT